MAVNGKTKVPTLVKTKWGFYQYDPKPDEEELRVYYEEKYYQDGKGSYETSYTDEEIAYFKLKAWLVYRKATQLADKQKGTLLDIGCGEGWILDAFHQKGWDVAGIDFSRFAIEKFHPHLMQFFEQGNIDELMGLKMKQYGADIIILANVIEHVIDPVALLKNIRAMMHPGTLLIIVAPNDFSSLQKHLFEKGFIKERFWLGYPAHLSYFNRESMCNLLSDLGFAVNAIVADNPIDLNLLNDNSNYIADRSKGKKTHRFRIRVDNFLAGIDRDKLLQMYEILGSMGVGRDLTYYCAPI